MTFLGEDGNQLEILMKSLKIREKILYKHHKDFEEVYYRLYSYYVEIGNESLKKMFIYSVFFNFFRRCRKYV